MKTMGKSIFSGLASLLLSAFLYTATASESQLQKTITWKYQVTKETKIVFDNYNCDLVIHVWNKSETEYHLTVEATGRGEDDEARLLKYLEDYKFSQSGSSVNFRNTFWKNRRSMNGKTTLEIEGQKDIELTEFNMKGELWVPAGNPLEMNSKYSRIDLEDFTGKLSLNLYNDNLYAGNVSGYAGITAKYANIEFKEMKDLKADLYNCDLEAGNMGNITVVSKYLKFRAKGSGNLDINSYNDKFSFEKTGNIIFMAKYSDLKTDVSGVLDINCYDGTVLMNGAKDIGLSSKYAEFQIGDAGNCKVLSSYNDKLSFGKVSSLKIDVSKYTIYKADELESSLVEINGYNDNFLVERVSAGFKELNVDGKYIDISVGIPVSVDYRLKAGIKYPSLEINESVLKTKIKVVENSQIEYDGVKGTERDDMPVIVVNGYNMSLKIKDL